DGDTYTNMSLVRHGCIGTAPLRPTSAFTIRTLALYRQTHHACPRLSAEAQLRALCSMNQMPYNKKLAEQFRIAYDAYLEIIYRVRQRVNTALGRNTPNWRALNTCPACDYRLEGEPELEYSKLISIDGNNSLRRVNTKLTRNVEAYIDSRTARTDYWITPEQVDVFKDQNIEEWVENDVLEPGVDGDEPGDVTAGTPSVTVCVERWKNAGPEERKKMWQMFHETGVFVAACRHGILLYLCDMIQSGELANYALAIVDKLIDVYGERLCIGYDIGCAFSLTVSSSPLLAPKAKRSKLRFVVPSFHDHAHNRACQLDWHPLYLFLPGLEDFEVCERLFSASNHLASATRHTTTFHRHQGIEEHFQYSDEGKYANLSRFLLNNYKQALELISTLKMELNIFKALHSLTDADFETFLEEEKGYLARFKSPRLNGMHYTYVEALEKLEMAEVDIKKYHTNFETEQHRIITKNPPQEARRLLTNFARGRTFALNRHDERRQAVLDLETQLDIPEGGRWGRNHPERLKVMDIMAKKDYLAAHKHLEQLVVQRLFELTKLNMSGTAAGLKRRSEAIRKALVTYNKMAAAVDPPREALSWDTVVKYSFLGEFDMLRLSDEDIRDKLWTKSTVREALMKYYKLRCACKEIERLNIEIPRLATSIRDESRRIPAYIKLVEQTDRPLAHEISCWWSLRSAVNSEHLSTIAKVRKLPGNSLSMVEGYRIGGHGVPVVPAVLEASEDASASSSLEAHCGLTVTAEDEESDSEDEIVDTLDRIHLWEDRINLVSVG
ncbi:hypothetical protein M422DRAFT_166820, partial [Sphaerobolus stellatus SS14]